MCKKLSLLTSFVFVLAVLSSNASANHITGTITLNGVGLGGVLITVTGGTQTTTQHNLADGTYTANHVAGAVVVTPTLAGYTFSPASLSFTLGSSAANKNFTAIANSTISGSVGLESVTMEGMPGSPASDANGLYSAPVAPGWSGTVTPAKGGYTFEPVNRTYSNVTASIADENYTPSAVTAYTISGSVGSLDDVTMAGLPGVPVITSGGGAYSCLVNVGWSGTVTPTKAGYTFTPVDKTYSNVTADKAGENYSPDPTKAGNPGPIDASKYEPTSVLLSWTAGNIAVSHDVYIGTDLTLVTNAVKPSSLCVSSAQVGTTYDPTLALNKTYYWRIDENYNTGFATGTLKGDVWSFTTITALSGDPNFIGWWKLDSDTGTMAWDYSGNGHHGTFGNQAAIVSDAERGYVLALDGAGDYVNLGNGAWTNPGNHMTIAAWFKVDVFTDGYQTIIAKGNNTYRLGRTNANNRLEAYMNYANAGTNYGIATGATAVQTGWHHTAVTYDGTTMKLYVDGNVDGTAAAAALSTLWTTADYLQIGRNSAYAARDWQGWIDDVRLYNRALSPQEIDTWIPRNYTVIDNMESYVDVINGPGGWRDFEFNPAQGGHTTIGLVANGDQVKKGSQSLKFGYDNYDNGHTDYYHSETVKIFDVPQDWSAATSEKKVKILTIPVRGLASNGKDRLFVALEDENAHSYTLYNADPNVLITESWQIWQINTDEFASHGVNMAKIKRIYLGVGTRYLTGDLPPYQLNGSIYFDDLTLNPPTCRPDIAKPAGDITNDCVVDLKDVKVMASNWLKHDITIIPEPVSTDNLKVQWTFDAGDAADDSGNGYNGTVTNVTAVNDPVRGNVMSFGGATAAGYISMPAELFASISNEITISLWQNGGTAQPIACSIFNGDNGAATPTRILNAHLPWSTGTIFWDAGLAGTAYDRMQKAATAAQYKGQWNHWAFTKNATMGEMKIYLNGQLWDSAVGMTKPMSGVARFNVGAGFSGTAPYGPSNFYDGMIDDFRIYSKALSDTEIMTLAGITTPVVIPVDAASNLSKKNISGQEVIDYKDFKVIADTWLDVILWP